MEFDAREFKPNLTLNFLLQQVEEQTEVCDLTIKIHQWERKYHRCVLKASTFFDCILKTVSLEKHTGTIHMTDWNPAYIDMTLMYLYGKEPELSYSNIAAMFDLAEFLMIPNLKSACVKWLNSQTISYENCLSLLQLSCIYEFELPQCIPFIESHLNEVFVQELCISLTYESIDYIFKEETFCYLHMERRLQFLIRWYKAQPEDRRQLAEKLLETIAFEEIPTTCLHEIKRDPVAAEMLHDVNVQTCVDEMADVLINASSNAGVINCFDLRRNAWFKITYSALKFAIRFADVVGFISEVSELLLVDTKKGYHSQTLFKLNLDKNELKPFEVVNKDSGAVLSEFRGRGFHFSNSLCAISKTVKELVALKVQKMEMEGDCDSLSLPNTFLYNSSSFRVPHCGYRFKTNSSVLIGNIVDGKVEMVPQFSIPDYDVWSFTANKTIVAMIDSSGYVLLYDTVECTLDKLKIKIGYAEIFSTDNGFVIHDNERCITIRRVSGPAFSMRYKAYEYNLHGDIERQGNTSQYFFFNNIWYRYVHDPHSNRLRFQCADHDMIEKASSPDNVNWAELTPPDKVSYESNYGGQMYFVKIPRRLQHCHFQCPHCKEASKIPYVCKSDYDYDDSDNFYNFGDDPNDFSD